MRSASTIGLAIGLALLWLCPPGRGAEAGEPPPATSEKGEAGPEGAAPPSLDDIFKEAGGEKEAPSSAAEGAKEAPVETAEGAPRSTDAIAREAGAYEGPKTPWFPAILNPSIGAVVEALARFGTEEHGYEEENTVDMREMEVDLHGSYDPFGRGVCLISGSDEVAIEEAYFLFTGLPCDLQLRAGKFFATAGRLNRTHTHDLPFIDQPLTMQNFLGAPEEEDDERVFLRYEPQFKTPGAELSWLVPTRVYWKLHAAAYTEFTDRSRGSFWDQYLGGPGFRKKDRNADDFIYGLGSQTFVELDPNHSLRLSGIVLHDGPDEDVRRTLEGAALTYLWFPLEGGLYKGLEWTTEAFANQERFLRSTSGVSDQASWGIYSYVHAKLGRRFSAGVLGEWSQFRFDDGAEAWHGGAWLSFYLSERQRIRFQVDRFARQEWLDAVAGRVGIDRGDGDYWSFGLQWVVVLGSHMHTYE
ncbi:MAG: hypothetical protein JXP34_14295 [Planctomycetes bacterium]|nr:hypothetical protein [Planctomycetota bacterium]